MSKPFRWGEKPPKWFMREVQRAFEMMGKNREVAHIFDASADWSFVFLVTNRTKAPELAEHVRKWYQQTYGGNLGQWPMVNSETRQPIN